LLAAFGSNVISSTGNITTTGNISGSYILGNGSQLTGLPATYSDANVTTLLAALGSNVISSTGNITTTANISGGNLLGTIRTATQTSITRVGTLTTLGVSGNASVDGYIGTGTEVRFLDEPGGGDWVAVKAPSSLTTWTLTLPDSDGNSGQFLQTNGSGVTTWATPTSSYGNTQVAAFLANLGSNAISSTANITTTANVAANSISTTTYGKIQGDFSSAVTAGRTLVQTTGTGTNAATLLTTVPSATNTSVLAAGFGAYANADVSNTAFASLLQYTTDSRITAGRTGTASFLPLTIYTSNTERIRTDINGNVGIANTAPVDKLSVNGTGYFSSNVAVGGLLTDNYYYANGTPISFGGDYGDSNVTTLLSSLGANVIDSTANITTTANISGAYILGDGSELTGIVSSYGDSNVATFMASFGSNTISTSGNITSTGNVSGGNLLGIGSGITGINSFGNIAVSGQTTVSADNTTDTLTLVAGTNITLTTDAANNKITITSSGGDTLSPFLLMGG